MFYISFEVIFRAEIMQLLFRKQNLQPSSGSSVSSVRTLEEIALQGQSTPDLNIAYIYKFLRYQV